MRTGLANAVNSDPLTSAAQAAIPVVAQLAQAAGNAAGGAFSDLGTGANNLLSLLQRGSGQSGAQIASNIPNGASGADLMNLLSQNRTG